MRLIKDIRLRLVVMTAVLLGGLAVLNAQVAVAPAQGDGTENNPYQIAALENLYWIAATDNVVPNPDRRARWRSHYIQTANINAAETREWFDGRGWVIIGNSQNSFRGTYNGQDHIIDSLHVNRSPTKIGLFGMIIDATISNLGVTNVYIRGSSYVGAIAGHQRGSTITNCFSSGNLIGSAYLGGLVGAFEASSISNSYSTVNVGGTFRVGGLAGSGHGLIENSYSAGDVMASLDNSYVGGLVGETYPITINTSYSTGSVTGYSIVGGLVGGARRDTNINNSYNTGSVTGNSRIGGFIGVAEANTTIIHCYNTGTVTGDSYVGGLAGEALSSTISYCYNEGGVTGDLRTGGLVGNAFESAIINSYNAGNVTGDSRAGGLVSSISRSTINNSYYNYEDLSINGENIIRIGALCDEMFNTWLDNEFHLDIDDYLFTDEQGRYLISTVDDFKKLLAFGQFEEYSYKLTANINLADHPDFHIPYFPGDFDGNGFVIENLTLNTDSFVRMGLFGYTVSANIKNLGVTNVDITGYRGIGSLVGEAYQSTISNSYSTGIMSGEVYLGGLVGEAYETTISNSYSTGIVSGDAFAGGLVGYASNLCIISNSFSTSVLTGDLMVGGLVGIVNKSIISNSYSSGSVTGGLNIGGFAGMAEESIIRNCYSTGNVTGQGHRVGGFIGSKEEAIITRCYWNRETSGQNTSDGGLSRTTSEMTYPYHENTYLNWDFEDFWVEDVNGVNNGYPYLQWQFWTIPAAASNPSPADSAVAVSAELERLSWEYLHNPSHQNPAGFRVYFNDTGEFDEDDEFVWVPYIEEQVEFFCADILPEAGLEYNTGYFWKVVPTTRENGTGEGYDAINPPVWSFRTQEEPTSADLLQPELVTSLHGNYPNPFNPATKIRFSIKEDTEAVLNIYNIKGQLVKTLHSGLINAGEQSLIWHGKDDKGREAGSGVYFYRLKTDKYNQVNKMLLVK